MRVSGALAGLIESVELSAAQALLHHSRPELTANFYQDKKIPTLAKLGTEKILLDLPFQGSKACTKACTDKATESPESEQFGMETGG